MQIPRAGSRICCWPKGGSSPTSTDCSPAQVGEDPSKSLNDGKNPDCQEFGLIRPVRAGRARQYQAPSGLETEPGPSKESKEGLYTVPAASKGRWGGSTHIPARPRAQPSQRAAGSISPGHARVHRKHQEQEPL